MVKKPARAITAAIDAAATRWSAAGFAPRVQARNAVVARTGYSLPVVEYAFDRLFGALRRTAIEAIIADELGCIEVLDGFVERTGRPRAAAVPRGRVCIVSSRTTIGVAIVPAIFALCAKCDVLVKDREDHLVGAFFETLAAELPELRDAAIASAWTRDAEAATLDDFEIVLAFGSNATLAQIAAHLRCPVQMIGYGTKASAGYITREGLHDADAARAIARGAARDLSLYETEGCLSLHGLFVERGGDVSVPQFSEMLVDALRASYAEFPPATADAATLDRLAGARELAIFRGGTFHSDPQGHYFAVVDPPREDPPLFLPRAIGIHSVEHPQEMAEYFERHGIALEALALAGDRNDGRALAARTHVARIAPFGSLQAPPLGAYHGGRPRIAEFVRWIGDET
jgi:hypothetical protein